ncbi:hypothetical protein AB0G79_19890 [Streptomyces sp. NPDC020807]|uniref:hypothetical protein n=1 Tax=Streptomyces sp. NPDC020807 TaxID=3155119 RepID=UPI0033FE2F63
MSSALVRAGFDVLGDDDADIPGLYVTQAAEGALVRWRPSDGFTSLTREQACRAASDDRVRVLVQTAVSGTLVELGHALTRSPDGLDLIVLADAVTAPHGDKEAWIMPLEPAVTPFDRP